MTISTKHISLLILHYVGLMLFYCFFELFIEFLLFYAKIIWVMNSTKDLLGWNEERISETSRKEECKSCGNYEGLLTGNDIDIVMGKLGMGNSSSGDDGKYRHCSLLREASRLLEDKEAEIEELKEAFSVFDENGDGFIDANKLQMVLCRLEFKEGLNLEDCEKMICAFDENGDGRINFEEFRKMLENVT